MESSLQGIRLPFIPHGLTDTLKSITPPNHVPEDSTNGVDDLNEVNAARDTALVEKLGKALTETKSPFRISNSREVVADQEFARDSALRNTVVRRYPSAFSTNFNDLDQELEAPIQNSEEMPARGSRSTNASGVSQSNAEDDKLANSLSQPKITHKLVKKKGPKYGTSKPYSREWHKYVTGDKSAATTSSREHYHLLQNGTKDVSACIHSLMCTLYNSHEEGVSLDLDNAEKKQLLVEMKRFVDGGVTLLTQSKSQLSHSNIQSAINSAIVTLLVMISSGNDQQVFHEESIESVMKLFKQCAAQLLEIVEQAGVEASKSGSSASKKNKNLRNNWVKQCPEHFLESLGTILGLIKDLLVLVKLDGSIVAVLVSTVMTLFRNEELSQFHVPCIDVLKMIFKMYQDFQQSTLQELVYVAEDAMKTKRSGRQIICGDGSINNVAGMLCTLLQTSVQEPDNHNVNNSNPEGGQAHSAKTSIQLVLKNITYFWSAFLDRWKQGHSHDFRDGLDNLANDLSLQFMQPEWPIAGLLLFVLNERLIFLLGNPEIEKEKRMVTLDLLSNIGSRLLTRLQGLNNVRRSLFELLVNDAEQSEDHEDHTVGISSLFWTLVDKDKEELDAGEFDKSWFEDDIKTLALQRLLLLYYEYQSEHKTEEPMELVTASRFLCSLWQTEHLSGDFVQHLEPERYYEFLQSKEIFQSLTTAGAMPKDIPRTHGEMVYSVLTSSNKLENIFATVLECVLQSLQDSSPQIRTKAVRTLNAFAEADCSILEDEKVEKAVHGRLLDAKISVREAAVDLIGKFIIRSPDITGKYFKQIIERIADVGLSVRKRAISIVAEILIAQTDFEPYADACISILHRLNDKEVSVREMVRSVFIKLWFKDIEPQSSELSERSIGKISRMMEAMVALQRADQVESFAIPLIERILYGAASNEILTLKPPSDEETSMLIDISGTICVYLLESILRIDERSEGRFDEAAQPYLISLQVFCESENKLCLRSGETSKFFQSLLPYISIEKDASAKIWNDKEKATLLNSLLVILRNLIQGMASVDSRDCKNVCEDAVVLILKHPSNIIAENAVKCLKYLAHTSRIAKEYVLKLALKFKQTLDGIRSVDDRDVPVIEFGKKSIGSAFAVPEPQHRLCARALIALGFLCQHCKDILDKEGKKYSLHIEAILCIYIDFLRNCHDFHIKHKTWYGCGLIFISSPQFMEEEPFGTIIKIMLTPKSEQSLTVQTLRNLSDFLKSQQKKQILEKKERNPTAKGLQTYSGEGDSVIASTIFQKLWDRVVSLVEEGQGEDLRLNSLHLVLLVLQQGLIHPLKAVSSLIALHFDGNVKVSKSANSVLESTFLSSYSHFFKDGIMKGLIRSYDLIRKKNSFQRSEDSTSIYQNGVSLLYSSISTMKDCKIHMLATLIQILKDKSKPEYESLLYFSTLLASIPIGTTEEALYCVHKMNQYISIDGSSLGSKLEKIEADENYANCLLDSDAEYEKGLRLAVFLQLKVFTRQAYSLDSTKILEFSPSSSKTFYSPANKRKDIFFSLEIPESKDPVQLQELLLRLLKADSHDFNHHQTPSKTPKSKKKRKASKKAATPAKELEEDADMDDDPILQAEYTTPLPSAKKARGNDFQD